jgi:3-(3-hydroxy-phenyl)propionate hydroxylase
MPPLHGGLLGRAGGKAAGTRFVQPRVRLAGGAPVPLDDVLGHGFVLLGWDVDPRARLPAGARAVWDRLPTRFVRVVPAGRSLDGPADPDLAVVEDVEGGLAAWFGRHRVRVVAVRPDRYVLAAFDEGAAVTDRLAAVLDGADGRVPRRGGRPLVLGGIAAGAVLAGVAAVNRRVRRGG